MRPKFLIMVEALAIVPEPEEQIYVQLEDLASRVGASEGRYSVPLVGGQADILKLVLVSSENDEGVKQRGLEIQFDLDKGLADIDGLENFKPLLNGAGLHTASLLVTRQDVCGGVNCNWQMVVSGRSEIGRAFEYGKGQNVTAGLANDLLELVNTQPVEVPERGLVVWEHQQISDFVSRELMALVEIGKIPIRALVRAVQNKLTRLGGVNKAVVTELEGQKAIVPVENRGARWKRQALVEITARASRLPVCVPQLLHRISSDPQDIETCLRERGVKDLATPNLELPMRGMRGVFLVGNREEVGYRQAHGGGDSSHKIREAFVSSVQRGICFDIQHDGGLDVRVGTGNLLAAYDRALWEYGIDEARPGVLRESMENLTLGYEGFMLMEERDSNNIGVLYAVHTDGKTIYVNSVKIYADAESLVVTLHGHEYAVGFNFPKVLTAVVDLE